MMVAFETSFPPYLSFGLEMLAVEVREQKLLATRTLHDKAEESTCPLARRMAANGLYGTA